MNRRTIKIGVLAICFMAVVSTMVVISSLGLAESAAEGNITGQQAVEVIRQVNATDGKPNPYYEEVKEVGFYPQERRLEAVIAIKQPYGYGGVDGTPEYIAFYVDYNNNSIFERNEDVGAGIVIIPDPTTSNDWALPISYAVYRDVAPPGGIKQGQVVRVRAILSWNTPPTGPDYIPVWGNIIERTIRIDPIR